MPKLERKADPPKKKDKPAKAEKAPEPSEAAGLTEGKAQTKEKKEKKDKKEPKEKGQAAAAEGGSSKKGAASSGGKSAPTAEDSGEPVPSMIDLRVGHILDGSFNTFSLIHMLNIFFQCKNIPMLMDYTLRYALTRENTRL